MSSSAERDRLHQAVLRHVAFSLGATVDALSPRERFLALALAVRDRMIERLLQTEERYRRADAKRLYYLSMEFLIGRSLVNNLVNLGLLEPARAVLAEMGVSLADLDECEPDAALGNGGLGRLAACFLDSLATLGMPGFGYGINYEYGLFRQEIRQGEQVEKADNWRTYATPWEIERDQDAVVVPLYGRVEHAADRARRLQPDVAGLEGRRRRPARHAHPRLRRPHRQHPAPLLRPRLPGRGHGGLQPGRLLPRRPAEGAVGNDLQSPLSAAPSSPPAASCVSSRNIFSPPAPSATSSAATGATMRPSTPSPTRSPSSSTTPTRRWRSRS